MIQSSGLFGEGSLLLGGKEQNSFSHRSRNAGAFHSSGPFCNSATCGWSGGVRSQTGPQVCCGARVTCPHPLPLHSVRPQSPLRGFGQHSSQRPPQFWLKWPENKVGSSSLEAFSSVAGSCVLGFWRTPEEERTRYPSLPAALWALLVPSVGSEVAWK